MRKVAVIMAGGSGAKFWPRTTELNPKPFIHLFGEGTMIQNTVFRLLPYFAAEDVYIITSEGNKDFIAEQLPIIPPGNIILEPFARNTAPCLGLASMFLSAKYPEDTIMMAFPADHVINNVREFHNSLDIAAGVAFDKEGIVTIGVMPTRPEPSFGYVQIRETREGIEDYFDKGVRTTTTFAEKPDINTARRFINSGDFLWNSGMFIWRLDVFTKKFAEFLPDHSALFKPVQKAFGTDAFSPALELAYRQMESVSIDYGILEKCEDVFVVESTFNWSDLGSWDELFRLSMKDGRNNFIEGDVIALNSSNSLISAHNKFIGAVGVDNLIIIDSEDSLLICKRGHSEEIIELVDYLRRKQINRYL